MVPRVFYEIVRVFNFPCAVAFVIVLVGVRAIGGEAVVRSRSVPRIGAVAGVIVGVRLVGLVAVSIVGVRCASTGVGDVLELVGRIVRSRASGSFRRINGQVTPLIDREAVLGA